MRNRTTQALLLVTSALVMTLLVRTWSMSASAQAGQLGTHPTVVRAQTIELVDNQGRIRANLKVEPDGEAVFRMMDAKGTIRVKIAAAEDGSGLLLLDDRTEPGVHALAKRQGTTLTLAEKGKEARVLKP